MQLLQKESDTKLARKPEEATLKRRRDKELHQAQLTALQAPVAPQASINNRIKLDNKDADKGILTNAARALMPQFIRVTCKHVIAIFAKKFKPENLCKLVFSINLDKDDKDFNISFNSNMIKQTKAKGKIKDYRNSLALQLKGFLVYASIEQAFYNIKASTLNRVYIIFYKDIIQLAKVYDQ